MIEAREMIRDFEVACFPYLKNKEDRERSYRKWHKRAYPKKKTNKSTKEMALELQRMFGG